MQFITVLLAFLLTTSEAVRHPRQAAQRGTRAKASYDTKSIRWGDNSSEYAFNLVAFHDGRRSLVRIYSEIEPKYVQPIENNDLSQPHVNKCHFIAANGTSWTARTLQVDTQWAYGDTERIRTVNKVIAYTVDCEDPGFGFSRVAPQLSTGVILGKHILIEEIETERQGRLAACSQPLFTHVPGLQDWVEYHVKLGVEMFHMHVPIGPHVDALFSLETRQKRINETVQLNERSPESVGQERFVKFKHPLVSWHDYYGAPSANYYSETPLFNACVYRFRYAYDFVMLYDCDEWFTLRQIINDPAALQKTIPDFLDNNLPPYVASLQLDSFAFPAQCAITDFGDYPSRFTLRKQRVWDNMQKLIVRPLAVACTAIHGIFDVTEQFKRSHVDAGNVTLAEKFMKAPTDVAYIKHIRWFGPPNGTAIDCKFGSGSASWDPENSLVVQDDSPVRLMSDILALASS